MTKLPKPVLGSQYCSLYYVSTLIQFFGDLNHVIVCRQRPKSDCFVILAAHVISAQHQRATLNLDPPNPAQTDTERVCYQRNKGQCTVLSHFQLTGRILKEKKGPQTNIFCFQRNRTPFVVALWALMSSSWFILSVTSGPTIPKQLHQEAHTN